MENNKQTEKAPIASSKSFMAFGPTLHYSHRNVQSWWMISAAVFGLCCLFWSKILTGSFWSFDLDNAAVIPTWRLGGYTASGLSIFEYPWQILVLGLLMGILAIVPVLVSQLMSFSYSLPLILEVLALANLPGFAMCLLISCIAVACRPLRFRSRFTAVVLCTAPQLFYWGYFGGASGVEPVKWGFSFTPWISAWLIGISTAGGVIAVGHFTRYRPGVIPLFTSAMFIITFVTFGKRVGFDELDYQLYVAKNNPESITEFHDRSIIEALDSTLTNPAVKRYLEGFFYPTEPIQLRAELKREIQNQLSHDRWPSWFIVPEQLQYQIKRQSLFEQYDLFINLRPRSRRMPIALYYKAMLSEYTPDIEVLGQKEIFHFYSDYPHERSRETWYRLYGEFGSSPESLEARWRIAMHWAGQGRFEQADKMLNEAQVILAEYLAHLTVQQQKSETLLSLFSPPAESAMTAFKLTELQRRLDQLRSLIGSENRKGKAGAEKRLARFVRLDPHGSLFSLQLEQLLAQMEPQDPLRDNVLLAQAKLTADEQLRAETFESLHKQYGDTDGGMQAMYELALFKIQMWRQQEQSNAEQKKKYLSEARATLTNFLSQYPNSIYARQVKKNLEDLPATD